MTTTDVTDRMLKHARAKHVEWEGYRLRAAQALDRAERMETYWANQVRELEGETDD